MSDLLPCPFCGGIDLDPLANCVGCLDCGARGPTQEEIEILCDPDFAKEQWNRRALPATDAREKALRGALAKAANRLDWAAGIIESNKARDQVGQWADEARAILRALEQEGRDG